jgi:Rrf2 family cysteine metabolism transcriptional repressor
MKLSTKCRYGSRAVVELAKFYDIKTLKRKELVESLGIPDSYLENILVTLRNRGIIDTIRGAKGGYRLAKTPESITMLDIVEALQGSLSAVACIEDSNTCDKTSDCITRPIWLEMQEAQAKVLKKYNMKMLAEKETTLNYII